MDCRFTASTIIINGGVMDIWASASQSRSCGFEFQSFHWHGMTGKLFTKMSQVTEDYNMALIKRQ